MAEETVKEPPPDQEKRGVTPSGALLLAAVLAASGALLALAIPRPVAPSGTPGLHIPDARADEARHLDRQRAEGIPQGVLVEQLLDAFYRHGNAERFGTTRESFQHDRLTLTRSVALLEQEHGDQALLAIQASIVEKLDDALAGRMEQSERAAFLGGFEETMATYGLVEDGEWLAPDIVVRALFKARFNAALRRPLTEGLHPVEIEAYWGWLALEARDAPTDRRLEALDAYEEARGATNPEARGVLLFEAGDYLAASEAFEDAYAATGNLRLRNHALAAMAEAGATL